jgi:hypothetical protein
MKCSHIFAGLWQALRMPPYPNRGAIKLRIIARVAEGETVAAICSEAGMPTAASVQVWRRADGWFAGELAAARRRGAWRRELMFDEAVAAAFLGRVAAGEKVNALLARPGMPSQRAYRYWRRTQPEFLLALGRLRAGGYSRRSMTGHPRWRAWDADVAGRLLAAVVKGAPMRATLASDPAFPSLAVLDRWRAEEPRWAADLKIAMRHGRARREAVRSRAWAQALEEEVGLRVLEGASLRALGAEDAELPCARTLYAWRRRWPSFARTVGLAAQMHEERKVDEEFEARMARLGSGEDLRRRTPSPASGTTPRPGS